MTEEEKTKMEKKKTEINLNNPFYAKILELKIDPEPYARPRQSYKIKNRFYNPRDKYKKKLQKMIRNMLPSDWSIIEGEIEMEITFYLSPPQTISNSKMKKLLSNVGVIKPITRPDIDNWTKPVMDAMNDIVYKDDSQITDLTAKKRYTDLDPYISIALLYRLEPIKLTNRKGKEGDKNEK